MRYCILVFFVSIFNLNLSACSCANSPKTFLTSRSEFTTLFEVEQIDTIVDTGYYKLWPLVLTKLKVIKSFDVNNKVTELWMDNSSGTDCQQGLFPDSLGQRFVITGRLYQDERYNRWIEDKKQRNFLIVSSCGQTVLAVKGDYVFGFISKNKEQEMLNVYYRMLKKDVVKARAFKDEHYRLKRREDLYQKMPLKEFYELMETENNSIK